MEIVIMWLFISSQGPVGGGVDEQTGKSLTPPALSVYVVMNSYLGLEGCTAGIFAVFVTLTKKSLALNCVPRGPHALSIHSLSCPSHRSSSFPNLSPIIQIRQVFPL